MSFLLWPSLLCLLNLVIRLRGICCYMDHVLLLVTRNIRNLLTQSRGNSNTLGTWDNRGLSCAHAVGGDLQVLSLEAASKQARQTDSQAGRQAGRQTDSRVLLLRCTASALLRRLHSQLRRRGLASALLRRAMSALRTAAKPREELFGGWVALVWYAVNGSSRFSSCSHLAGTGGPKDTSLRAVEYD